jgi:hypothetical protein
MKTVKNAKPLKKQLVIKLVEADLRPVVGALTTGCNCCCGC